MQNFIHFEGGDVLQDLPDPSKGTDDYFRVGPRFEAALFPLGTAVPVSFSASYGYYVGLMDDDRNYRNLKIGMQYRVDKLGHIILKAEYINGLTPILLQMWPQKVTERRISGVHPFVTRSLSTGEA